MGTITVSDLRKASDKQLDSWMYDIDGQIKEATGLQRLVGYSKDINDEINDLAWFRVQMLKEIERRKKLR